MVCISMIVKDHVIELFHLWMAFIHITRSTLKKKGTSLLGNDLSYPRGASPGDATCSGVKSLTQKITR